MQYRRSLRVALNILLRSLPLHHSLGTQVPATLAAVAYNISSDEFEQRGGSSDVTRLVSSVFNRQEGCVYRDLKPHLSVRAYEQVKI